MWLPKPVYESLPYVYVVMGAALLLWSFLGTNNSWLLVVLGMLCLVLGLILWLKRNDYRTGASEYNRRSLDE